MFIKQIATTLIYFAVFTVPAAAQGPAPSNADSVVSKEAIEASVKGVPCETDRRLAGVKKLFTAAGAAEADITIQKLDNGKISNVVVAKKGATDETVVIGAHYDRAESGCGVTDNWTGVAIISHIYETIRQLTTKKSYVFVAFDKEESGLHGSAQMLKSMTSKDMDNICSMVNFDSFGQGQPMALKNASSPKMIELAEDIGKEAGLTISSVEIPGAVADSLSFRRQGIPAITISGLAANWTDILHTSSDTLSNVNIDSVYLGYRFGLIFLTKIDAGGCREFR